MNAPNIYPNGPSIVPPLAYGDLCRPRPASAVACGNRKPDSRPSGTSGSTANRPRLEFRPRLERLRCRCISGSPCSGCAHDLHDALSIGHQRLRCRRGFPVDLCLADLVVVVARQHSGK